MKIKIIRENNKLNFNLLENVFGNLSWHDDKIFYFLFSVLISCLTESKIEKIIISVGVNYCLHL